MERVVVTGAGAVSPLGHSLNEIWTEAKAGKSGIGPVARFDVADIPWKTAGTLKDFDAEVYLRPKEISRLDPFVHYAVAAATMATAAAGLTGTKSLEAAGVIIGSSRGGIGTLEKAILKKYVTIRAHPRLSAYLMPSTTISMAASYVSQKIGSAGYCLGISNACASGANAIGEAYRLVKSGYPYPVLCGGTEAPVCRTCLEAYGVSGALSRKDDSAASRPFDRTRDGFVLSEGACILVLESYESALHRGAEMYGEIIGYGNTTDSFHQTVPSADGEARAIRSALDEARLKPRDIDFVSAHGTSTRLGDKTEAEAIRRVFGRDASVPPVTALKSLTGHMLAASGALEAALSLLGLKDGVIFPTINLLERDPHCDLPIVTKCRSADLRNALCQSFGFGGLNAVLVLRKATA